MEVHQLCVVRNGEHVWRVDRCHVANVHHVRQVPLIERMDLCGKARMNIARSVILSTRTFEALRSSETKG